MSLVFNDTTTYRGLVQLYEKEVGLQRGTISGDTDRLKEFTADVNEALDDFTRIALRASGTWQWDDSNQTDYPIITTDLISGQRDYTFTTDGNSNLILDIYKVFVASPAGIFTEMLPVDVESGWEGQPTPGARSGFIYPTTLDSFTDGLNQSGTPNRYDKLANGIFLDPIPNYNSTNGLKMYVNREASYFVYTDTTKKAGIPGILQRYLFVRPAYDYARRNNLANASQILLELIKMEGDPAQGRVGTIAEYFSARPRDERNRLVAAQHNNK